MNSTESITLIAERDPMSPISEAYRAIRTNLQFAATGKTHHIVFTSSTPGEGKSTTIANVALTLAQDGKHVLLIDADMRKPVQHKNFQLSNRGLSHILAMRETFDAVVHQNVFPNLDVLTSGPVPPNPAELLNSDAMNWLWQTISCRYDYVLVDAPPVLAVTDAVILGTQTDGAVFVVRSGKTSPEEGKAAVTRLRQAHVPILGVILNDVPDVQNNGYYYYYDENHQKHKQAKHS